MGGHGLFRGISPWAVTGSDGGGCSSVDSLLIQLSGWSVPVGYVHDTRGGLLRVGLFGELLKLLLSGLDLCCRAQCCPWGLSAFGRSPSPGSEHPASVPAAFLPRGKSKKGQVFQGHS